MINDFHVDSASRVWRQWLSPPRVAVAGRYVGNNVGDTALKEAAVHVAETEGVDYGVQMTVFRKFGFSFYPRCEGLLVAGGALGQNDLIEYIAERYGDDPRRVALWGIDFTPPSELSERSLSFLGQIGGISCRSTAQARRYEEVLGRPVTYHPDNAFCHPAGQEAGTNIAGRKELGINLVPFTEVGIIPGQDDRKQSAAAAYRTAVRQALEAFLEAGYAVTHVPFTPADEHFAGEILRGLEVTQEPFRDRPAEVIGQIAGFERFIATRLHAHIFAVLAGTPFFSIAYAGKCERLQEDLPIPPAARVRKADLLEDPDRCAEKIYEAEYVHVDEDRRGELREEARRGLSSGLDVARARTS